MPPPLALGMFASSQSPTTGGVVFGASVAARDFTQALLRWGPASSLRLFSAQGDSPAARKALARLLPRARWRSRPQLLPLESMALGEAQRGLSVWHDIDADTVKPFIVRGLSAAARYPITLTHHTFSLHGLLHLWFLPLLLEDVRPYDAVVCTSVAARKGIQTLLQHVSASLPRPIPYRGRLELIPLGVDTDRFRPRPKAVCRRALKLPEQGLLLLWVGRLSVADKADLLPTLSVFQRLLKQHPPLHLVLAGTPLQQEQVVLADYARALGIAKRVKVLPGVDPSRRHLLHAAADIFLSPVDNIQETIGLTPLEAMACGVPQVVSDWDGYRDTVTADTGFLVPTWMAPQVDPVREALAPLRDWQGRDDHLAIAQSTAVDVEAMFSALDALVRSPQLRKRLGEASRRRAVAQYGWDVVMKQYGALWRELGAQAARTALGRPRRSYRHPPYLATFGPYATGFVNRVRITDAGKEVLAGKRPLPAYYLADADEVEAALVALERAGDRGMPAGEHGLWLLKYGFAQRN